MLIGNAVHGVDVKGRVFIPAKWRDDLGASIVISHGILGREDARCLFGMSLESWKAFGARFNELPETDVLLQEFRRMMYYDAEVCEMDKQGRILLPSGMREYANLDKEAILVGVDTRIEIWNAEALEEHKRNIAKNYSSALQQLAQRGI